MNRNKTILNQLIQDMNSQNLETLDKYFDEDSKLTVFTVNAGQYTQIQGKEEVVGNFRSTFDHSDAKVILDRVICDGDTVAISGNIEGRELFTIHIDEEDHELFSIRFMAFIEFRNGKIVNFDYSSHTFEAMRLSGLAVLKMGDREQIMKYLSVLKNSGMIPEKMIYPTIE